VTGRLSRWTELHSGRGRLGVVLLVAVATLAGALSLPSTMRDLGEAAARNSALSFADREIAGGNALVADQSAVYQARARIPEDGTYHVAVGPGYTGGSELTVPFVESYYRYFLMPRRPAEDAPWIVCYGCDLRQYGPRAKVVWEDDEGIAIVRLRR